MVCLYNESMKHRQRTYYADGLMPTQYQNYKLRSDIAQDRAEEAGNYAYERGMVSCDTPPKKGFFARLFSKKKK